MSPLLRLKVHYEGRFTGSMKRRKLSEFMNWADQLHSDAQLAPDQSVRVLKLSAPPPGEEHPVPLCEGGGELPEEEQLWRGRWGGKLMTPPRRHLPKRDTCPQHPWPQEVLGSELVTWPRGASRCELHLHHSSRWPTRGTPTSIITPNLQCQEETNTRPKACGRTGIKPQLPPQCLTDSEQRGRFTEATTNLHWGSAELLSATDGAPCSHPVSMETQTVL